MPNRSDVANSPNYIEPCDNSEFSHVEVWECVPTGEYLIWDAHNEEFHALEHRPGESFMDAALRYEERMVSEQSALVQVTLQAAIDANLNHRSRQRDHVTDALSMLPEIPTRGGRP